jgi:hypothetical protein
MALKEVGAAHPAIYTLSSLLSLGAREAEAAELVVEEGRRPGTRVNQACRREEAHRAT